MSQNERRPLYRAVKLGKEARSPMQDEDSLSREKRAQILRGASQVFAAEGYEGASMAQIAASAGVSKGTLYNHFETKAALFTAYIAGECERSIAQVFDRAEDADDPAAVLQAIGRRMVAMMLSDAGLTIYRVVIAEAGKFPDLARGFFEAGPARAIEVLADWLARETARGRLDVADAAFAAEQFFALCQTHLALRRRLRLLENVPEAAIERIIDAAIAMFLARYGR
jgi:TetR/AcrR family transcriptional repressor of mexJK operon